MTDPEQTADPFDGRLDRRSLLRGAARLGGAVALSGLGVDALSAAASPAASARRGVGPYRRARQPNILVVMVDQLRTPRWFGSGAHAAGLPPQIAGLARAGVSFARHYTASNDCTPARAALVTGLHTHQTGCMITGQSTLQAGFPTYGSMLREHGYASYWYGKWHLTRGDHRWSAHDGPPALGRYGFDGGTFPSPDGAPGQGWRVDPTIASQFERWYRESAGDEPWCTTVSFVNPHDIAWWWRWSELSAVEASAPPSIIALPANFESPAQLAARRKPNVQLSLQQTSDASFGVVPYHGHAVEAAWLPFLNLYVKLQREVDHQVGRVMATLASRRSVSENTIVVFTSDHGEYGASHGLRGKGAGLYEEAINVPLIVTDFTGRLGAVPNSVRHQLTSSVDVAPFLLTLASGSSDWRTDPRYAQIASRPDLARIVRDPAAPGRAYVLHATDEVMTEFALQPYTADAPLHITGVITRYAKYASYSHWRPNTIEPLAHGQQAELYDHTTRDGYLEIDNLAGRSAAEGGMRATLARATRDELHAPLPFTLVNAQRRGLEDYHRVAAAERAVSQLHRLHAVETIVQQIERHLA
jgi:arylsulfatase A-like enzyme